MLRLICAAAVATLAVSVAPARGQVSAPPSANAGAAYYQFLLGRHAEDQGEIDRAIAAYREAARLDATSADIRAELAALFVRQGRVPEAITEARAALQLDQKNIQANRVLGEILAGSVERGGRAASSDVIQEAIQHLERGRRSDGVDDDPSVDVTLARLYLETESYDKAIAVLAALVERQPIAEAYLLLAQAQQSAGRPDDAARSLELGADANPRLFGAVGELYERQQQWDKAAEAYERAAAAQPQSTELKLRLATALMNQDGDAPAAKARTPLDDLVRSDPNNDRALYLLSQAQRRVRDFAAAEASARRVIALDPKGLWGPFALAQVYEDQRQYRQALDTLSPAAAAWQPTADQPRRQGLLVLTHLGFVQIQLGETEAAIKTFERARSLSPDDSNYDVYLAQAHLAARQYDEAVRLLAPVRARRPADVRLAQIDARALAGAGRREEAITVLQEVVKANPSDPSAWLSLADVLSESSRTTEALKVLDDAQSRFPESVTVPFQRGALYERSKEYGKAEASFRDVLARDPLNAPALNYLGYMFADRGERLEEAVELIERALKIDPENGSYLDSLGWALFKQRKLDQARRCLSRAAEQLPANSVVQEHFGDVLSALEQPREAIAAWQRALAGDRESIDPAALERKIRDAQERAAR
jgi:tetratricopeptide (TPR) repeat protein